MPSCWIRGLTGACQNRVLVMSAWMIYNCNMQNWVIRKRLDFVILPTDSGCQVSYPGG
nr:MAG TPA: hypothetical protein [Caudoviricetes sp.]